MSRPDKNERTPVRRAVTEVFAKGAPAPAKLALPLSLFLLPPALAAQEAASEVDDLPVVFVAPPPESQMSEATVEKLRALTAIMRLERIAALEPELNDLKYSDPTAALAQLGIELPETVAVAVTRDEATGEDHVRVEAASFQTLLRFDPEGRLIPTEEGQDNPFAARSLAFDSAVMCCYTGSPSSHCNILEGVCYPRSSCYTVGNQKVCNSIPPADRCFSPYFTGIGSIQCNSGGF